MCFLKMTFLRVVKLVGIINSLYWTTAEHDRHSFTSFASEIRRMWNLDFRIIKVFNQDGLCSIGWDTSMRSSDSPDQVATFNMYTQEFGTMPYPSPRLPIPLEYIARAVWKDPCRVLFLSTHPPLLLGAARTMDMNPGGPRGPLELEFSLQHPGVIERCPGTVADDDLEIIFGDYGYFVLCYDETIDLPTGGSFRDKEMIRAVAARPPSWWPVLRRPEPHYPEEYHTNAFGG